MRLTRHLALVFLVLAVIAALPAIVSAHNGDVPALPGVAQGDTDVTYGLPVEGALDDQTPVQVWTLRDVTADRIKITAERLDGNLIPGVRLLDEAGEELRSSYGADDTGALALLDNYTLSAPGTYQIEVARENGAEGVTSGGYRLTVLPLGLAEDHPNNTAVKGAVAYDTPVTGDITALSWQHVYTLDAQVGDLVNVRVTRVQGTLFPEVELLDNNGASLRTGYVDQTGTVAEFERFEIRAEGQYQVVVRRERDIDGDTVGSYELTVSLAGSGEDSQRLAAAPVGTIDAYDTPLAGEITDVIWMQRWQFTAEGSDRIRIVARRVPGFAPGTPNALQPELVLLGAGGQNLRNGYTDSTGAVAIIDAYDLQTPGTYTVAVMRAGGKDGATTGTYEVTISLLGVGEDHPALDPVAGEVTLGTPVEGEVTNARWADAWTFTAQQDVPVTITVTRTGGTLWPLIELQDSNGASLRTIYTGDAGDSARYENYRFPTAGEYRIVVMRDREQDGATSGTYSLLVEQTPAQ